jgi:2-methylcitrate dehydratase PrpD
MTNAEIIAWQNRIQSPVEKALRRAFSLGQTYWQQADSDYASQWKKSDATKAAFEELVAATIATEPQP